MDNKERDTIIPMRLSKEQQVMKILLKSTHGYTWDKFIDLALGNGSDQYTAESWCIGYMSDCIWCNDFQDFDKRDRRLGGD